MKDKWKEAVAALPFDNYWLIKINWNFYFFSLGYKYLVNTYSETLEHAYTEIFKLFFKTILNFKFTHLRGNFVE